MTKYNVIAANEFEAWLNQQEKDLYERVYMYLNLLAIEGPNLTRPHSDTLKGSSIKNLKELRIQYQGNPYRILYVFDPKQQAFVMLGGNKASDKRWYKKAINQAEAIYAEYVAKLKGDKQ